jgi:hypothetical protein
VLLLALTPFGPGHDPDSTTWHRLRPKLDSC